MAAGFIAEQAATPFDPHLSAYEYGRWYALAGDILPIGATPDARRGYEDAVRANAPRRYAVIAAPKYVDVYSVHRTAADAWRAADRAARAGAAVTVTACAATVRKGGRVHRLDVREAARPLRR